MTRKQKEDNRNMVLNMYTYILNEYLESWLSPKVEKQIVKQHHYIEHELKTDVSPLVSPFSGVWCDVTH